MTLEDAEELPAHIQGIAKILDKNTDKLERQSLLCSVELSKFLSLVLLSCF